MQFFEDYIIPFEVEGNQPIFERWRNSLKYMYQYMLSNHNVKAWYLIKQIFLHKYCVSNYKLNNNLLTNCRV